jgi:serine/threonine protein kinase
VVSLLGWRNDTAKLYIIMEYVPGGSIRDMLKTAEEPFSEHVIRNYTRHIVKGLEYCHSQGVVHRDIKGGNILIGTDGVAKIADFGGSKLTENIGAGEMMVQSATMAFSILWMAPEVANNKPYCAKIDVWSLACVVIEMATKRMPWFDFPTPSLYLPTRLQFFVS